MTPFHIHTCPVCGGQKFEPFSRIEDRMVSRDTFGVERCTGCGLLFTQDAPPEDRIGPYYKTDNYISHSDTREGLMNRLYHYARRIMLERKRKLFDALPLQTRGMLDIGAGTGYFAHHMQEHGWLVSTIEPDEDARLFMQKTFGILAGEPDTLYDMASEKYSVVTMWHVLEHVYDLDRYLKTIHSILKEDGYFVLALPNPDCYDARAQGADWSAWDVPRHLWHFNPAVTEQLLRRYGFALQGKHIMPFDSFYNALKTYILRGDKLAYIKGPLVGLIAWGISLWNKDKASSLIYVAKKVHTAA